MALSIKLVTFHDFLCLCIRHFLELDLLDGHSLPGECIESTIHRSKCATAKIVSETLTL